MMTAWSQRRSCMVKRVAGILLVGLTLTACGIGREPDPTNKVVVILDRSRTYQHRLEAAIARVRTLLESMSRRDLKRWESDSDQIVLISLDALPEVIWRGTLRDLQALDHGAWTSRLQGRSDYARCTDVDAAFRLAGQHLQSGGALVNKYLVVFSDLVHEPPTASLNVCWPPAIPSVPSETFPWDVLSDVRTTVFWVPAEQKLAWSRAVAEQGLQDRFALYTTSESDSVTLEAPERAKDPRSEAEREVARAAMQSTVWTWLWRLGTVAILLVTGVTAGFVLLSRRGRRPSGRPVTAPRRRPARTIPGGPQGRGPRPPLSTPSTPQRGERREANGDDDL